MIYSISSMASNPFGIIIKNLTILDNKNDKKKSILYLLVKWRKKSSGQQMRSIYNTNYFCPFPTKSRHYLLCQ